MNMDYDLWYDSLSDDKLNNLTLPELDTLRKNLNQVKRKELYKRLNEERREELSDRISSNIDNKKHGLCLSLNISLEELEDRKQQILDLVQEEKSLEEIRLS